MHSNELLSQYVAIYIPGHVRSMTLQQLRMHYNAVIYWHLLHPVEEHSPVKSWYYRIYRDVKRHLMAILDLPQLTVLNSHFC